MTAPAHPSNALDLIGRTPLVRLSGASRLAGAEVLGKCEFLNPGMSVKDRIALFMVEAAERSGALEPGGVLVEATAGNTGIGLAMVAAVKGYRLILVIPDTMSREKIDLVRAYGAEVRLVEKKPWGDPDHYNRVAERISREIPKAVWVNQFDNPANRRCHYETTGPEIWNQVGGKIDFLFGGMGTGGTLSGAGRYLKERNPRMKVVAVDPHGSVYHDVITRGVAKAEGSSVIEGVGIGRVPGNFDRAIVDDAVRIDDATAIRMTHRLAREEGLLAGGCAGLVVAGAVAWLSAFAGRGRQGAESGRSDPGAPLTAVAILTDTGRNYMSRLFDSEWLTAQGLPVD